MSDYRVILEDMPWSIKSFVKEDSAGYGTIVVNSRLNHETQVKCYDHEVKHLEGEDFSNKDVDEIELTAHK